VAYFQVKQNEKNRRHDWVLNPHWELNGFRKKWHSIQLTVREGYSRGEVNLQIFIRDYEDICFWCVRTRDDELLKSKFHADFNFLFFLCENRLIQGVFFRNNESILLKISVTTYRQFQPAK